MRRLVFVVALTACGGQAKPVDEPAANKDPELAALATGWTIENHIITPKSDLSDADAADWHGRAVAVSVRAGYQTPFQGNCRDASYTKRRRSLNDVALDEDLAGDSRHIPERFGLPSSVMEFKFICRDTKEDGRPALIPILTIYQAGDRAMTCFSGVCYLLARR